MVCLPWHRNFCREQASYNPDTVDMKVIEIKCVKIHSQIFQGETVGVRVGSDLRIQCRGPMTLNGVNFKYFEFSIGITNTLPFDSGRA